MPIPVCHPEAQLSPDAVRSQLERILKDGRFATSERNARFLRYVVERTLEGEANGIKEVVIATELYSRSTDYNPKTDSLVRVEATRVRTKLQSYYDNKGARDPILIHIPKGTYVPQFQQRDLAEPPAVPEVLPDLAAPHSNWGGNWARLGAWIVSASATVVLMAGFAAAGRSGDETASEAMLAWQEGKELLRQDPHSGLADGGLPPTLQQAMHRFEAAVTRDPQFGPAWASLAEAYEYAAGYLGRDRTEDASRAEAAARKAVALNNDLPQGHAALALVLFYLRWDFKGAEAAYRKAISLDPRNAWAVVEFADLLRETGRVDEAADVVRKARALQPGVPVLAVKEAEIHLDRKRPDAAMQAANEAVALNQDYKRAQIVLGMAWEAKGEFERALACYRDALSAKAEDRRALPAYGYLAARMGQTEEARNVLQRLEEMNRKVRPCSFQIAMVHAGLGETEQALASLERALESRQMHVPFAAVEYRFNELRSHPRFRSVLKRAGVTDNRL